MPVAPLPEDCPVLRKLPPYFGQLEVARPRSFLDEAGLPELRLGKGNASIDPDGPLSAARRDAYCFMN
jgi:hypothetical protein